MKKVNVQTKGISGQADGLAIAYELISSSLYAAPMTATTTRIYEQTKTNSRDVKHAAVEILRHSAILKALIVQLPLNQDILAAEMHVVVKDALSIVTSAVYDDVWNELKKLQTAVEELELCLQSKYFMLYDSSTTRKEMEDIGVWPGVSICIAHLGRPLPRTRNTHHVMSMRVLKLEALYITLSTEERGVLNQIACLQESLYTTIAVLIQQGVSPTSELKSYYDLSLHTVTVDDLVSFGAYMVSLLEALDYIGWKSVYGMTTRSQVENNVGWRAPPAVMRNEILRIPPSVLKTRWK